MQQIANANRSHGDAPQRSVAGVGEGEGTRSSLTLRPGAGIVAPSFVSGDLLAEYALNEQIQLNVLNVTNAARF